jgi:hypothetical protein
MVILMKKYVQYSSYSRGNLVWIFLGIIFFSMFFLFELRELFLYKINFVMISYFILFLGLFIWRYGFSYIYILGENEITIQSKCLCFSNNIIIPLKDIEFYADRYKRSLFRKIGVRVNSYKYAYCGGDGNKTRVILFVQKEKKKAVLFKGDNHFMGDLQSLLPEKYLDIEKL